MPAQSDERLIRQIIEIGYGCVGLGMLRVSHADNDGADGWMG